MAETEYLALDASIDTSKWDAAVSKMLADAARIETMLSGLESRFAGFGDTLADIDVSVTADVDTGAVADFTTELESIPDVSVGLIAEGDTEGVDDFETALNNVADETVAIDATADASEIEDLIGVFDAIPDEDVTVTPAVDEGGMGQIDLLLLRLTTINGSIELVHKAFGALGTGVDFAMGIISPVVELDDAMAILASKTGKAMPELQTAIEDMFAASDSATREQIAQVMATGIQWGIAQEDIVATTQAVLDFADTFDKDAISTLTTFDSMIKAGLVSNATEAFNLLTIAEHKGADKGGDLLSTITAQAGALKEMGLSGQEVISGIGSGIQAGLPSASSVIDLIKAMVRTEGNTAAQEAITALGLDDEKAAREAGTLTGGEYVQAVLAAIAAKPQEEQGGFITKLFGGRAAAVGAGNILGLDFQANLTAEMEGAGAAAAEAADNTIRSTMTVLSNTISMEIGNILRDKFNIQEFLDEIKEKVKTFSSEIQSGAGLFGALEVALELPGLEDKIGRIESAINNFLIGLLDAVANVGEFLGRDVSGIRSEVTRVSAGQLAFDLTVADGGAAVQDAVNRAIDRGVDESQLSTLGTQAVNELISEGDVEQAQELVTALGEIKNVTEEYKHEWEMAQMFAKGNLEDAKTLFATMIDDSDVAYTPAVDTTAMQMQVDVAAATMKADMDSAKTSLDETDIAISSTLTRLQTNTGTTQSLVNTSVGNMVYQADTSLGQMDAAVNATDVNFAVAGGNMVDTADTTAPIISGYFQGIVDGSNPAVASIYAMVDAWNQVKDAVAGATAAAGAKPGEGGGVPGHAAGGRTDPGFFVAGENGPEAIFSDKSLAVLNNQTTDALFTALRSMGGIGGGVTNNRTTNANMPVTINVQNTAQGDMAGRQVVSSMRGF